MKTDVSQKGQSNVQFLLVVPLRGAAELDCVKNWLHWKAIVCIIK